MSNIKSTIFEGAPFIDLAPAVETVATAPQLPEDLDKLESVPVLKACVAARSQLAALNETCRYFSKPHLLQSLLPILEVHASAALDGYVLPIEKLLKNSVAQKSDDPLLEKLSSRHGAMLAGHRLIAERSPGVMTALEVCSVMSDKPVAIRREEKPGHPGGVENLQKLLGCWEDFIQVEAGQLDPLIIMAVAYAHFLHVSPFERNNGAVARIFCQLFFTDEELIPASVLNLSGYFKKNIVAHDEYLLKAESGDSLEAWVLFFVKAVEVSAQTALIQLRLLNRVIGDSHHYIKQELPKIYSPELVDVLFENPYCRIQDLVERDIVKRQTASQYLKRIAELGLLVEQQHGKEKLFMNKKLLDIVKQAL